jgi:hypothetical protein
MWDTSADPGVFAGRGITVTIQVFLYLLLSARASTPVDSANGAMDEVDGAFFSSCRFIDRIFIYVGPVERLPSLGCIQKGRDTALNNARGLIAPWLYHWPFGYGARSRGRVSTRAKDSRMPCETPHQPDELAPSLFSFSMSARRHHMLTPSFGIFRCFEHRLESCGQ